MLQLSVENDTAPVKEFHLKELIVESKHYGMLRLQPLLHINKPIKLLLESFYILFMLLVKIELESFQKKVLFVEFMSTINILDQVFSCLDLIFID